MDIEINANTLTQLKITSATCSFFALGATAYRIYKRRDRLWADDAWALFASIALIIQVVAVFLHIPPPNHLSHTTRIAVYYLTATTFYLIVWASRLSILFSIVRIDPSIARCRRLLCVAVAFFMTALLLLGQLFWVCESKHSWKNLPNPQCGLPLQVAIFQIITDVISDSILLFAPLPLFRSLLDKSLSVKLTIIFSVCVVTTIVSLVHASFILKDDDIRIPFSGILEGCLSLVVANIPVIITTMIDIIGESDSGQTANFSTIFWLSEARMTATGMPMHTVGEEHVDAGTLSYVKSAEDMSSESWISSTLSTRAGSSPLIHALPYGTHT
ncbi:hypothetical protein B0H19DRAFT_1145734 [Mycena capillaripes]|nr:hypothetical protein B0H19DRAFT_1145734 [Mycena capillaripes]